MVLRTDLTNDLEQHDVHPGQHNEANATLLSLVTALATERTARAAGDALSVVTAAANAIPTMSTALAARPLWTINGLNPPATTYLGPPRVLEWRSGTGGATALPYLLSAYFDPGGGFATGVGITISNKRSEINGTIQGVGALFGAEPNMLAISNDVNGPGIALEGYGAMGVGNTDSAAIAVYDLDTSQGATGMGPYSPGFGTKRWMLSHRGKQFWGADLSNVPLTNYDVSLERINPGILRLVSPSGPAEFQLNCLDASGSTIKLMTAGTTRLYIGAGTPQTQILQSGVTVIRLNDDGTTVIGDRDGGGAVLSLRSSRGGITVGLRIDQNSAGQSSDMLVLSSADEATNLHRFNKDGYSITKKNSAPADDDLVAGECTMWFDSTNGAAKAMFKAKQANGIVKTAAVALA